MNLRKGKGGHMGGFGGRKEKGEMIDILIYCNLKSKQGDKQRKSFSDVENQVSLWDREVVPHFMSSQRESLSQFNLAGTEKYLFLQKKMP